MRRIKLRKWQDYAISLINGAAADPMAHSGPLNEREQGYLEGLSKACQIIILAPRRGNGPPGSTRKHQEDWEE